MTEDRRIQQMLDRAAIREVLLRYAHGVDRQDLPLVESCFVPGAAYQGSLGTGTFEEALDALRERIQRYKSTMHLIGNHFIELDGDTAKSETYTIAYHLTEEVEGEPIVLTVAVRYLDDMLRYDGDWRIESRVVQPEWQRYDDVFPAQDGAFGPTP